MLLEGSCHCGAVCFSVESRHPLPYQRCYCTICRKTSGGGGFLVNTEADAKTLKVTGEEHLGTYCATITKDDGSTRTSKHERKFCRKCGTHLYAFNPSWLDLLHPVATAIDTELQAPPSFVHMMTGSKASWVSIEGTPDDQHFDAYPAESLADWHDKRGKTVS